MVTKLKNSNGDKTQKHKLWQNSKTQIAIKLKMWRIRKKSKTQNATELKLWQHSNTKIFTKLKNSNCDETQKLKFLQKIGTWQILIYEEKKFKRVF